jgi:hypothetical protein
MISSQRSNQGTHIRGILGTAEIATIADDQFAGKLINYLAY